MNIQRLLDGISLLGTSWVLWLLFAFSITGLAIIIERVVCYWASRDDVNQLGKRLAPLLREQQWQAASKLLSESPSFEAKVALASLDRAALAQPSAASADELMLGAMELGRLELERYLGFLSTLGANAPFVGLLGTVIGIVHAFQQLDVSSGSLTEGLMAQIGESLIATAAGLIVALPAIAAFNLFRRVVQTRIARAEALRRTVLGCLRTSESV
ncbi:MAG TPA: MotA/TolQ/ExbB proton channel family protein [Polyangiaceae bacterium]|jgi:biopolymer transport protein ExbB|nr:MotA/TolQ/ExbB proton channel family protein [Polyangiaceae bacterium]